MRVVLDDESGMDITEMGTKKRLAMYVVRQPARRPRHRQPRARPARRRVHHRRDSRGILQKAGRSQIKGVLRHQGTIAGIGNAYSDELLHAAKMSPFKPSNSLTDAELQTLYDAIRNVLGDAVERSRGLAASELKGEKKSHLAVHGRTGEKCPVCGDTVREVSFADSACSTAPPARPAASPSPTGGCRGCSSSRRYSEEGGSLAVSSPMHVAVRYFCKDFLVGLVLASVRSAARPSHRSSLWRRPAGP